VLWPGTMMERCRCDGEWLGSEISLSWYTMKFRNRHDELGYVKYCAPRLRRNGFLGICFEIVVVVWLLAGVARIVFPGTCCLPPSRLAADPRWLVLVKIACLAVLLLLGLCYLVVHLVPRFTHLMGSFAREAFLVFVGCAAIVSAVSTGHFCLSQLLGNTLEDAEVIMAADKQHQLLMTMFVLTATHLMVPVRWYLLVPLELVSIFWYPFWVLLTSSWNDGSLTMGDHYSWYGQVTQFFIVVLFAMGKRYTECAERYLFKKYLSEKSLRVSTEFKLSSQLKVHAPSETPSHIVFANLGLSGELKQKVDCIVALGQKERWVLDAGVAIDQDRILGQGGFGKVCLARLHGTPTVVKMPLAPMHEWVGVGASHLQALANEIRLLRRLRHPNIVLFHGAVFFDRNTSFGLVLEYVDGVELNACVSRLSKTNCVWVCVDLSRALQYLHAQDPPIIHGDLKPSNLMIVQVFWKPRVKLIDFGLSRLITPNAWTNASSVGGTREWIPPEQIMDSRVQPTHQLDIFAFGSLAYFMEHGVPPMKGMSCDSEVLQDSRATLAWPSSARSFLTGRARDAVHACLHVSPGMRPRSIDDVRHPLEEAVEELKIDERPSAYDVSEVPRGADWSTISPEAAVSHN